MTGRRLSGRGNALQLEGTGTGTGYSIEWLFIVMAKHVGGETTWDDCRTATRKQARTS